MAKVSQINEDDELDSLNHNQVPDEWDTPSNDAIAEHDPSLDPDPPPEEVEDEYQPEDEEEEVPKKKGMSALKFTILSALGIISVGGIGLIGYVLATGNKPVEPEVSMAQPKPAPVVVAPVAPPPPPVPEAGGYDPATDPAYQQPAAGADPNVHTPIDTTISPFNNTPTTAPTAVPVQAGAPVGAAAVTPAPAGGVVVKPNAVAPAATPATYQGGTNAQNTPVTATPVPGGQSASGAIKTAAATPTTQLAPAATGPVSSLTAPANQTVNHEQEVTQEARIAALEAKIAELQEMINKLTAPKVVARPVVRKAAEPKAPAEPKVAKVKPEPVAKPAKEAVTVTHTTTSPAVAAATVSAPTTEYAAATPAPVLTPAKTSSRPFIAAIVPGRAFLQNSEGVRSSIAVGDQVANCGAVTKIDPDASEVITERCVIR